MYKIGLSYLSKKGRACDCLYLNHMLHMPSDKLANVRISPFFINLSF
jgi:hypothetical protein